MHLKRKDYWKRKNMLKNARNKNNMSKKDTKKLNYRVINEWIIISEKILKEYFQNYLNIYDGKSIYLRLTQAVSKQMTDNFDNISQSRDAKVTTLQGDSDSKNLTHAGVNIDITRKTISPSLKLFKGSLAKFSIWWCYILLNIGWSLLVKKNIKHKITLVFGVPSNSLLQGGSSESFESFCKHGHVDVLNSANAYIVQSLEKVNSTDPARFSYCRFPLVHALYITKFKFAEVVRMVLNHLIIIFKFCQLLFKQPIACLLWRDYAEYSLINHLNKKKLIENVIITNSNWLQQFLWMSNLPNRSFKVYMALYSLNSYPYRFKGKAKPAQHPGIRHLRVDCIYTWNNIDRDLLIRDGITSDIRVVRPILWYMPQLTKKFKDKEMNKFNICIFDISPRKVDLLLNRDVSDLYISAQNMKLFITDILTTVNEVQTTLGVDIDVVLKHKRLLLNKFHDTEYFEYIDRVVQDYGNMRVISPDTNLFQIISSSDLIVVFPYTSPAYIAESLGVEAIFYDPTDELDHDLSGFQNISFAGNRAKLRSKVFECLNR